MTQLILQKIAAITLWGFSAFKTDFPVFFFSPLVAIFGHFLISLFWLPLNTPCLLKPAAASLHNLLQKKKRKRKPSLESTKIKKINRPRGAGLFWPLARISDAPKNIQEQTSVATMGRTSPHSAERLACKSL